MKPPKELPPLLVALGEAYARRAGIDPGDFWAYVYRKAVPPAAVRAALVEAFFPLVPPESFLPSPGENDTLDTMDATQIAPARRGRPLGRPRHPFVAMLKKRRLTVAEVAKAVNRSASSVKAWYKPVGDDAARPIPRAVAEKLAELYGVPLTAWTRIAD